MLSDPTICVLDTTEGDTENLYQLSSYKLGIPTTRMWREGTVLNGVWF